ncbi:probable sodium-coupled neutral amino acid transporter 6 [Tanacetum coccineum]
MGTNYTRISNDSFVELQLHDQIDPIEKSPQNPIKIQEFDDLDEFDELEKLASGFGSNHDFGSGLYGAVFNLTTSVIGAGIMALPATMKVLGFAVQCKANSYGEVVEHALGKTCRIISEICIVINNAGVLVVYLIILGDVMSGSLRHIGVFDQWLGNGFWDHRKVVIFIVVVVFLAPLCLFDKIDSLSTTSAASVALAVVFVVVAFVVAFIKVVEGKIEAPRLTPDFRSKTAILDLLVVIPIMSNAQTVDELAFEGRGPLYENRKRCVSLTVVLLALGLHWVYDESRYLTSFKFTDATTAVSLGLRSRSYALRLSILVLAQQNQNPEAGQTSMGRDGQIFMYNPDYLREQFAGLVIQRGLPFNHFDHEQTTRVFQNTMQPRYTHVPIINQMKESFKQMLKDVFKSGDKIRKRYIRICRDADKPCYSPNWDVDTRWNSTFEMFESGLKQKTTLAYFHDILVNKNGRRFKKFPVEYWVMIEMLNPLLEVFQNATVILSGVYYPTSPLVLQQIFFISCKLSDLELEGGLLSCMVKPIRKNLGSILENMHDITCSAALNPCFNVSGVDYLIENISRDLEFQDDGFATRSLDWFHESFQVSKFFVASESALSTSGRLLTIRRTRLTPESLEMCMCLKDHLDAHERKQDTSPLELPLDVEECVFNVEVQQNEATQT